MTNSEGSTALPRGKLADGVLCPFCSARDTRLINPFGGQLSVAQYWCRSCRTGFDYMKWEGAPVHRPAE